MIESIKLNNHEHTIIMDSLGDNLEKNIQYKKNEPENGDVTKMTKTQLKFYIRKYKTTQDVFQQQRLKEFKKELKKRKF